MAKANLEDLSTDELEKRKKFGALVLGILVGLVLANIISAILVGNLALIAIAPALLATGLVVFKGLCK